MYGFLIIFYIGLPFFIYGAYVLRCHSKMKQWPNIQGKLAALEYGLEIEVGRFGKFYYRFPKPTYEYQVDGVKYLGYKVNHDIKSTWIAVEKPDQQPNFYCEVGGLLRVHYNPKNPAKSVLQVALSPKRKSHYLAICVSGILLIAISIGLAVYIN
jgi:Protein of unknown function (DUF3592)